MSAAPRRPKSGKPVRKQGDNAAKRPVPGLAARRGAAGLLALVLEDGEMLAAQSTSSLAPQEQARAQTLARLVLRHLDAIDKLLARFVTRRPKPGAKHILRVAAAEMLLDTVPPHAAVDAAVRLAQESKSLRPLAGMINAVGRKLAAEGGEHLAGQPPQALPDWLETPVKAAYSGPVLGEMLVAHRRGAPLDLSLRAPHLAEPLAAELGAEILPTGSLRLVEPGQVSTLPGYDDGAWWVQDAAAALPARMLGDVTGLSVLDLCAAPGGKTLQLAAGGAKVTALDLSESRLHRLHDNLARTRLSAEVTVADARDYDPGRQFDVVVLDAPCSASGTIRRHPDLPHVRGADSLAGLLPLQAVLLDSAARLVAPGGRLLYCTCSLLPAEGEAQVEAFLARDTRFQPAEDTLPPGCPPDWQDKRGGLRLLPSFWPDRGGMDGFFAAVLQRDPG